MAEYFRLREQTLVVLRLLVRRFPPSLEAPARDKPLDDDSETLETLMAKIEAELDTYLGDPKRSRIWVPGETVALPGSVWATTPLVNLRSYAARLADGRVGSVEVERLHWRMGRTRTKLRSRIGYVRNQAFVFLDQHLNSARAEPSKSWGDAIDILNKFVELTDDDEAYLNAMDRRFHDIEAKAIVSRAAAAETNTPVDEDDDEPMSQSLSALPDGPTSTRNSARAATSRFYVYLKKERENQERARRSDATLSKSSSTVATGVAPSQARSLGASLEWL